MGFLNSIGLGPELVLNASTPDPTDDSWYQPVGAQSLTGIRVSEITAVRASAVLACLRRISDSFASLPLVIFKRGHTTAAGMLDPARGKTRQDNHALFDVIHHQPNGWMTAYEFWQLTLVFALLWGDSFNEIIPGRRGFVNELIPLHPDRVTVEQLPNGRVVYMHRPSTGPEETIPQERMFHIKGMSLDGLLGLDTILVSREAIALALASEAYAARLFANDASGRIVLSHPQKMDEAPANRIAKSWRGAYGGFMNAGTVAVLEEGMTATVLSQTGKEAEQIATREFQAIEIARIFGVPQHKIGILDNATFSNITEQNIEYVQDTLMPWAVRIEQAIRRDLIVEKDTFFPKFIVEGLLRGDPTTRSEFYSKAILDGWLTRNEVRDLEDRNPLEGLDAPLSPLNMGSGGQGGPADTRRQPRNEPEANSERFQAVLHDAADRVVHKEIARVKHLAERYADDQDAFEVAVAKFYDQHTNHVVAMLHISIEAAMAYTSKMRSDVLRDGVAVLADWELNAADWLAAIAEG